MIIKEINGFELVKSIGCYMVCHKPTQMWASDGMWASGVDTDVVFDEFVKSWKSAFDEKSQQTVTGELPVEYQKDMLLQRGWSEQSPEVTFADLQWIHDHGHWDLLTTVGLELGMELESRSEVKSYTKRIDEVIGKVFRLTAMLIRQLGDINHLDTLLPKVVRFCIKDTHAAIVYSSRKLADSCTAVIQAADQVVADVWQGEKTQQQVEPEKVEPEKEEQLFRLDGSYGQVFYKSDGTVVRREYEGGGDGEYDDIVRIDVDSYIRDYGALSEGEDILWVGYWNSKGLYEPAEIRPVVELEENWFSAVLTGRKTQLRCVIVDHKTGGPIPAAERLKSPLGSRGDHFRIICKDSKGVIQRRVCEVTDTKVGWLQQMTKSAALLEGVDWYLTDTGLCTEDPREYVIADCKWVEAFITAWDKHNPKYPYSSNPPVRIIDFKMRG